MTTSGTGEGPRARVDALEFLHRARDEALRYGHSSWVFIRELVQNGRDAGARYIDFEYVCDGDTETLICRDDGRGMSLEEARRDLLTLYASHKTPGRDAGRFGVGFWSVLNFDPLEIEITSAPRSGDGWRLTISRDLSEPLLVEAAVDKGTVVSLKRRRRAEDVCARIFEVVRRDTPFVPVRDEPGRMIEIRVAGTRCDRDFGLPAPSLLRVRRRRRLAVGLDIEPQVDVFAHGLRVRTVTVLDDLLLFDPSKRRSSRNFKGLGSVGGLYPRVVLDSPDFEVLMNRGDLRENAALKRAVGEAERELALLIRREMDQHAPLPLGSRTRDLVYRIVRHGATRWSVLILLAAVLLAVVIDRFVEFPGQRWAGTAIATQKAVDDSDQTVAYTDLGAAYPGPGLSTLAQDPAPFDLSYSPAELRPYFGAVQVNGLSENGVPVKASLDSARAAVAVDDVAPELAVQVRIDAPVGAVRLPVPATMVIVGGRVSVDGRPRELLRLSDGSPALFFEAPMRALLDFECAPMSARNPRSFARDQWPDLPPDLSAEVAAWSSDPVAERVRRAEARVLELVRYDVSSAASARFERAMESDQTYFSAVLAAGVGDCDIQAALLTTMLLDAGVEAAMMVGWRGENGRALAGMHAWVEYRDEAGMRQISDPTLRIDEARHGRSQIPEDPHPATGDGRPILWIATLTVAASFGCALLAWWISGRRRNWNAGNERGFRSLVRTALVRPESFRQIPLLYARPCIPLLDGHPLSLGEAARASREGRLYAASPDNPLATGNDGASGLIVDRSAALGRIGAECLPVIDLDQWLWWLDASTEDRVSRRIEAAFRAIGEQIRVRRSAAIPNLSLTLEIGNFRAILLGQAWPEAGDSASSATEELALLGRIEDIELAPELKRRLCRAIAIESLERTELRC